jgi:protein-S-isoprenylcysteine O-methyltransferase Ste14
MARTPSVIGIVLLSVTILVAALYMKASHLVGEPFSVTNTVISAELAYKAKKRSLNEYLLSNPLLLGFLVIVALIVLLLGASFVMTKVPNAWALAAIR